jgi:hypothetical protein
MRRDRLRRASVLRAFALGAVLAPLVVAWGAASCVLADPPPALFNIPSTVPSIQTGSVVPPAGQIFTDWPRGGLRLTVPVEVVDPNQTYWFLVMKDYRTPNSVALSTVPRSPYYNAFSQTNPDGGFLESPIIPLIEAPADPNCHTYWFFVGPSTTSGMPSLAPEQGSPGLGYFVYAPSGFDMVSWIYSPSGGIGTCAAYDASGLADTAPEAADASDLDGLIVPVDSGD